MIDLEEFARRLSTLGAEEFTGDDVIEMANSADVRLHAGLPIDASMAQRLLDQISPPPPVTAAQITASPWPPPTSSRPPAPPVSFSSPGAVDGPADQPSGPRRPRSAPRVRRPGTRRPGR